MSHVVLFERFFDMNSSSMVSFPVSNVYTGILVVATWELILEFEIEYDIATCMCFLLSFVSFPLYILPIGSLIHLSLHQQMCTWTIGRIPKDKTPSLSGTFVLETGVEFLNVYPTFQVGFRIMGIALSGLQVDKLDLKNMPNRFYKGFRALTRAGKYEVRS